MESDIHYPTDSELLWDCVRVMMRLMGKAREILGADVVRFADRTRRTKRRRKEINTNKRRRQRGRSSRDLLKVAIETHRYGLETDELRRGLRLEGQPCGDQEQTGPGRGVGTR